MLSTINLRRKILHTSPIRLNRAAVFWFNGYKIKPGISGGKLPIRTINWHVKKTSTLLSNLSCVSRVFCKSNRRTLLSLGSFWDRVGVTRPSCARSSLSNYRFLVNIQVLMVRAKTISFLVLVYKRILERCYRRSNAYHFLTSCHKFGPRSGFLYHAMSSPAYRHG